MRRDGSVVSILDFIRIVVATWFGIDIEGQE